MLRALLLVRLVQSSSSTILELLLLDPEVTLREFLATLTSFQMPNDTRARTVKRTMMMIAMTSFFLTMMGSLWPCMRATYEARNAGEGSRGYMVGLALVGLSNGQCCIPISV